MAGLKVLIAEVASLKRFKYLTQNGESDTVYEIEAELRSDVEEAVKKAS